MFPNTYVGFPPDGPPPPPLLPMQYRSELVASQLPSHLSLLPGSQLIPRPSVGFPPVCQPLPTVHPMAYPGDVVASELSLGILLPRNESMLRSATVGFSQHDPRILYTQMVPFNTGGNISYRPGNLLIPNSMNGCISSQTTHTSVEGWMRPNQQFIGRANTDPFLRPNKQLIGRPNSGPYLVQQQTNEVQQTRSNFPDNGRPQINLPQQNFLRQSMVMDSSGRGYKEQMLLHTPMDMCGGSFQELLRTVSMPTSNWDSSRHILVTTESHGKQDSHITTHGEPVQVNDCGQQCDQDVSDPEEESDEDVEYHDADDEESDADIDKEAGKQGSSSRENIDTSSEISMEYEFVQINEQDTAKIKKRRRFPKGYVVPDFRAPRDIGTIEKAMRNAHNRGKGHIFEPKIGMVFDSRAEIYNFYNLYSWEVGFGIRFGCFAKNRVNKMRTMQELVCEKEGFDSRCKNNSKRMHCKAKIRLLRTEDLGWYVTKHVSEHNHPLSVSCGEKREWNSHSRIEDCTKKMIRYLRDNNVTLSKVHCIMGDMYGSMGDVPFNQKSLRSVCSSIARDQKDDDISKTLEVFRKMRAQDPGFQFSVDLGDDKKVKTLIWTSGRSRSQYNFFGDAITFDTTYCTNIYKMPFGMFVGVNNHFQSVMFAGVLMTREDTESFKWVFKEFITLMGGKFPVTILTDQCKAMTKAIKEFFPAWVVHLWCKWHVLRYAPEEIGPAYRRNGAFRREFHYVINQMLTIDEFERAWEDLLQRYNLRDNEFMKKTYSKRHKWAKPWSKHTFCARMASTQRSESANSILKKVVPRNSSMNRFVEQYDKLMFLRARAEQKAEHQTKQFVHRAKRMYAIEKHAISIYTKNCFALFSEEVDKATDYDVDEADESDTYIVIHNNAETRKHWARVVFKVKVENHGEKYSCECGQYEHFGILCCHAIKVMIHNGVKKIPQAHIMKRWTRDARDYDYPDEVATSAGQQLGQTLLYANALDVVKSTEKSQEAGQILTKYLNIARKEIEGLDNDISTNISASEGDTTNGYMSATATETENEDQSGYDSDGNPVTKNVYGAAGSSAYMSDADVNNIQAPEVPKESGRRREKRYKPVFERKRKGRKRYTACPMIFENSELHVTKENTSFGNGTERTKKKSKKG